MPVCGEPPSTLHRRLAAPHLLKGWGGASFEDADSTQAPIAGFLTMAMRELDPQSWEPTARVVDWGCGQGELVNAALVTGLDIVGCDFRPRTSRPDPGAQA